MDGWWHSMGINDYKNKNNLSAGIFVTLGMQQLMLSLPHHSCFIFLLQHNAADAISALFLCRAMPLLKPVASTTMAAEADFLFFVITLLYNIFLLTTIAACCPMLLSLALPCAVNNAATVVAVLAASPLIDCWVLV